MLFIESHCFVWYISFIRIGHPKFASTQRNQTYQLTLLDKNVLDLYQEVKKPAEEATTEETEKTEAESTTNDEKTEETTNGDATHDEKDGKENEKVQDEETLKRKEAPTEPVSESKKTRNFPGFYET